MHLMTALLIAGGVVFGQQAGSAKTKAEPKPAATENQKALDDFKADAEELAWQAGLVISWRCAANRFCIGETRRAPVRTGRCSYGCSMAVRK